MVNFKNFCIQFGHNIEESIQEELIGTLGIQNIGGIYLGMPEN